MRRVLLLVTAVVLTARCAAPPPPVAAPETPPPPPAVEEEKVTGTVRVTASALNVRRDPSSDAEVLTQVKKGTVLPVLLDDDSWLKVRLPDGGVGWVASRFVTSTTATASSSSSKKKRASGCPADSDFAFLQTPTLAFSDSGAHGLVVVDATVNTKGVVTSTKLVSNTTGDEALGFLAEREIKSAKFAVPIRNCVPRSFVFTYRRTY